jgi:phosphomannomutase
VSVPQTPDEYQRHCPGEENVPISDAICFGRRRANFRKCSECEFNDNESAFSRGPESGAAPGQTPLPSREPPESEVIERVFKAYDVRATVPDPLNDDVAWRIGNATAQFLRTALSGYDRSDPKMDSLILGRDMRRSSPALSQAFAAGVLAVGTNVIDVGMIDTSQIAFATNFLPCCGGVQTTASHNPANYNGFKISGQKGKPIGAETGLQEIERIAKAISRYEAPVTAKVQRVDLSGEYRDYLLQFLRPLARTLTVVVDASNGMAGRWFPIVFEGTPNLKIIPLNFEHNGEFVHPPNPLAPANLEQLRAALREQGADFGACFDGDADRCIFVDENAEIVRCDLLTAVLAGHYLRQSPGAVVVYDLRSSRIVPEQVKKLGGVPRRERVGHVFMKRALADHKGIFGGELSGHFYFHDFFNADSGLMAFIAVLNVLSRTGESLGALLKPLNIYAASGERNFHNEDKDGTIRRIADTYAKGGIDYLDGITVQYPEWWFNLRPSNTEPLLRLNMEAINQRLLEAKLAEVMPLLGEPVEQ